MIEGLFYWLMTLLPEIVFPEAFEVGILMAVEYVYWGNYYLPVDVAAYLFSILLSYKCTLYMIKFLIHSLDKVI